VVFLIERGDFVAECEAEPHGVSQVRSADEENPSHRNVEYPAELYPRKIHSILSFVGLAAKNPATAIMATVHSDPSVQQDCRHNTAAVRLRAD